MPRLFPLSLALALAAGLVLLAHWAARTDPLRAPVDPTLADNPELVLCGPYDVIRSGAVNRGTWVSGAAHSREVLACGTPCYSRQGGTVRCIRVNL